MRILVKIGGTLLDAPESRLRLAREIGGAAASGLEIVVVHGGGKQMSRFLEERGIQSHFVNGLRVTTSEVLDAVVKVVAGSVNKELVSAFVRAGHAAVGISGIDAGMITAEMLDPALLHVGKPVAADPRLLETLIAARFVPVVACVAGDRSGGMYNINADQMAAACAAAWRAERLLFLTDVDGVRGKSGSIEEELDEAACDALIRGGVATGGMQAKLRAALGALAAGVREVIIVPGARENIISMLLAGEAAGTRVVQGRTAGVR